MGFLLNLISTEEASLFQDDSKKNFHARKREKLHAFWLCGFCHWHKSVTEAPSFKVPTVGGATLNMGVSCQIGSSAYSLTDLNTFFLTHFRCCSKSCTTRITHHSSYYTWSYNAVIIYTSVTSEESLTKLPNVSQSLFLLQCHRAGMAVYFLNFQWMLEISIWEGALFVGDTCKYSLRWVIKMTTIIMWINQKPK